MSRNWRIIFGLAVAASMLLSIGSVQAQGFERRASEAIELSASDGFGALFWSHTARCDKIQNDMSRRQCAGVLAARTLQTAEDVYLVRTTTGVVELGNYDTRHKSAPVIIRACVACEQPISLGGGNTGYVVGHGATTVGSRGKVGAPVLLSTSLEFSDKAKARKWRDTVMPRLRTELLFRLGAGLPPSFKGGVPGVASVAAVDVIGYRVYDACKGNVLYANPPSKSIAGDARFCSSAASHPDRDSAVENKPTNPNLPDELSAHVIASTLAPLGKAGHHCHDRYATSGLAKIHMVILGSGKLTEVELHGDFKGTPTGKCLLHALRRVSFPKSNKPRTQMLYPVSVR